MGGSYYLEALTTELGRAVIEEIEKVDRMGGSVAAIQKGYIQTQIRESAFKQQMDVESGKKKVVGVNAFNDPKPYRVKIHRIDQRLARAQTASTKALKRRRNQSLAQRCLAKLQSALERNENSMPFIIEAVEGKATTGEISNVVRELYGEFHPKPIF
jgi:methylmalonyl-CoA mutase N-terminal domain/subunit